MNEMITLATSDGGGAVCKGLFEEVRQKSERGKGKRASWAEGTASAKARGYPGGMSLVCQRKSKEGSVAGMSSQRESGCQKEYSGEDHDKLR